jgi:hypothetical protein
MGLPIFLFERRDRVGYDEALAFVVAASAEDVARVLLSAPQDADSDYTGNCLHAGDEGADLWLDPKQVTCLMISKTSIYDEPTVVLRSFRNG